nr:MYB26 protein [Camellia japonica]
MFGDHHNYSSSDTNRWSMIGNSSATQSSSSSSWTKLEDKVFEQALVMFPEEMAKRWEMIAEQIPGKSAEEVRAHYEALVHDVLEIDSGRVELPSYSDDWWDEPESTPSQISFGSSAAAKTKHGEADRKKGTPWTEEEHRYLFFFDYFLGYQTDLVMKYYYVIDSFVALLGPY